MFNYLKWPKNEREYITNGRKFIYRTQFRIITGFPTPLLQEVYITSDEEVKSNEQMQIIIEDMISGHERKDKYPLYVLGEFEVMAAYINE